MGERLSLQVSGLCLRWMPREVWMVVSIEHRVSFLRSSLPTRDCVPVRLFACLSASRALSHMSWHWVNAGKRVVLTLRCLQR